MSKKLAKFKELAELLSKRLSSVNMSLITRSVCYSQHSCNTML